MTTGPILPDLPEPDLYIGTKLLPYEERHFGSAAIGKALGYTDNPRVFYSAAKVSLLLDEIASLRKDADRYRWLRSDDIEWRDDMPYVVQDTGDRRGVVLVEGELDTAVDEAAIRAAIKESQ